MRDIYKEMKKIRNIIDKHLVNALDKKNAVDSFHSCLNGILSDLKIKVSNSTKQELSVYGDNAAYQVVTYVWFYLRKLENNYYIQFVQTPDLQDKCGLEIGQSEVVSPGFLAMDVSNYIREKDGLNIIVSPEFKDYIAAGHQTLELKEAKKSSKAAFWSALFAGFSTLLAIITLVASHCGCCAH